MEDRPGDSRLRPRTGPAVKLLEGPRVGQRSLYQQHVLDEDTYTEALSNIITRDFFPNLPHIHATNAYLTALTNNDPELLSSSIRRLAQLAKEKDDAHPAGRSSQQLRDDEALANARREFENAGTPYISKPGGPSRRAAQKTPVGARGWDTPDARDKQDPHQRPSGGSDSDSDGLEMEIGEIAGPSQPKRKRRKVAAPPRVRDDLSLDAFQRNYTSEDNASFVQIVDVENQRRREERWGWAWEAEERAKVRRLEGEERRKLILDAATSGQWRVNAEGKRLTGSLAEGGADRMAGEVWKEERKLINAAALTTTQSIDNKPLAIDSPDQGALVMRNTGSTPGAMILATDVAANQAKAITEKYTEEPVSLDHPLGRALAEAGLPTTALISKEDGALVPVREVTSGAGDGRGRGLGDRDRRELAEKTVMGDETVEHLPYAGSGGDGWGFKTRNNFYFLADANTDPYPKPRTITAKPTAPSREAPPSISHSNTRLQDEDEVGPARTSRSGSRRGSSPARSWVDAAVKGTPYHPRGSDSDDMPSINNYPLLPNNPSPVPEELPSLLTWGTLMATPRALDGSDDPLDESAPSFRLPETRRRDEIGRKLGDKASRSMNERAKGYTPRPAGASLSSTLKAAADRASRGSRSAATPGQMAPPSTAPRRSDQLTPAGKRLLERSLGRSPMTTSGRAGIISASGKNRSAAMEAGSGWNLGGKGKRVGEMSWTPSPAHRKS